MKKPPAKTKKGADPFKVPGWFRKLWNGKLFGKRKDDLVLRILKLGGKDLLMSRCGLHLERDMIEATPAPSIRLLLALLREAEADRRETEKSLAMGALMSARPQDYNIEEKVLINRKDLFCKTEIWTPKQPRVSPRK